MLVATELATAAVWDAARAAELGGAQRSYTAAVAATLAMPAADLAAQLNIQVHGGIGFTWEHDAHLYLRRATALEAIIDADGPPPTVTDLVRDGVVRARTVDLPPEAEAIRDDGPRLRRRGQGPRRGRAARSARRVRLRHAALARAVGPRRRRGRAARHRAGVRGRRDQPARLRHHRLGHPHPDPARHRRPGRALGPPGARPGGHLVPALQRARRRLRRRGHQDPGHPGRRRLAGQRPEGLDQRRPRRRLRARHGPHQPRRHEARGHHDDGHRHARRRASRCGRSG